VLDHLKKQLKEEQEAKRRLVKDICTHFEKQRTQENSQVNVELVKALQSLQQSIVSFRDEFKQVQSRNEEILSSLKSVPAHSLVAPSLCPLPLSTPLASPAPSLTCTDPVDVTTTIDSSALVLAPSLSEDIGLDNFESPIEDAPVNKEPMPIAMDDAVDQATPVKSASFPMILTISALVIALALFIGAAMVNPKSIGLLVRLVAAEFASLQENESFVAFYQHVLKLYTVPH
jgi:hypothetical protein